MKYIDVSYTQTACPTNGNCSIACLERQCKEETITCPLNGDCFIDCVGDRREGCEYLNIDATQQNGNFEFHCGTVNNTNNNVCRQSNIQGSKLTTGQTGISFAVTCGGSAACFVATIACAQGMDCEINCDAYGSCGRGNIVGPTNYKLRIKCADTWACRYANIHAENSSLLELTCSHETSCSHLSIYCPINSNQNNICRITGIESILKFLNGYKYISLPQSMMEQRI